MLCLCMFKIKIKIDETTMPWDVHLILSNFNTREMRLKKIAKLSVHIDI